MFNFGKRSPIITVFRGEVRGHLLGVHSQSTVRELLSRIIEHTTPNDFLDVDIQIVCTQVATRKESDR